MTGNRKKYRGNPQNASGACTSYHVALHMEFYIWGFVVSFSRLDPRRRTGSGDTGRPGYAEANLPHDGGRRRPERLLTQSLECTRTAKRAAGERALCVLRHPRPFPPFPPSIARSIDDSSVDASSRSSTTSVPRIPGSPSSRGGRATTERGRETRVPALCHAFLPSPAPPYHHTPQLSSAARAIVRAQLSAFTTVDALPLYS